MTTLLVEAVFALVFLRALMAYVRRPDSLQRDVVIMFSAMAVLFTLAVARQTVGAPPRLVSDLASALLLGQPFLTLRVVRQVQAVPAAVYRAALVGWLASAAAIMLGPEELPGPLVAVVVLTFVVTEGAAAAFLFSRARVKTGAARARLLIAAAATLLFAGAITAAGAGAGDTRTATVAADVAQGLAALSAVGYLAAFAPPRWLRRLWSSRAAYALVRRLLAAPVSETLEATWGRYANTVREATGADAAALLLCPAGATIREVARVGLPPPPPGAPPPAGCEELLDSTVPTTVAVRDAPTDVLPVLLSYARRIDARFVTVVPLPLRTDRAVLVLLDRYRSLFTDDDVQLLGELGAQAAALAERGELLEHRDRLTAELSHTVQALTIASQAKSDFLANMSHELRTPLNAIIGFSDLMRTEPSVDQQSTVPTDWIHHINSGGHHLLGLINEILDLAKIEAGQLELQREAVDLSDAVGEVVTTLRALSDGKHLEVTVAVPSLWVNADPMRLRQIVTNLLSNAIKFTPAKGRIYLAARRLGADIALSIADTGPGIASKDQHRVFQEFQQAGEVGARAQGTGLGLALTRRLVHAHGGRVEVDSEPGHGAKFTVYLPAATATTAAADTVEVAFGDPGATSVLIVEDDAGAVELLRTYLETAGYSVGVAGTGEQALVAARAWRPEAILLDLQLPDVDGWQVLSELKGDDQLRHIPVVIISVSHPTEIGLALGAVDYFVKPVSRNGLLTWLTRHGLIPAAREQALSVLAIDDDPVSLEIIDTTLTGEGMHVTRAQDGAQGLLLARRQTFQLIICDLLMPGVDGFDVIAALHNDPDTRSIPVVVLTAHSVTEADKKRLSGKVIAVMSKAQNTTGLPDLARVIGELTGLTAEPKSSEPVS